MIELDGSQGEGGGQIVRTALALSTLTGKPFRITNIRQGRTKSGLKAQHIHCVKALEKLCNAQAIGVTQGSSTLEFIPSKLIPKNITVDIGTAGSVTLFLQAILLPLMFASKQSKITVIGGTNGMWAMPVEYFQNVLAPQLKRFADVELFVRKRGYYPKGGGRIEIKIVPKYSCDTFTGLMDMLRSNCKPFSLVSRGKLQVISGISHASRHLASKRVADRQKEAVLSELREFSSKNISVEYVDTFSIGSGITLWASFSEEDVIPNIILGSDALGEKRKSAEDVGIEAAKRLRDLINSPACCDKYLADNLIPFMALLPGSKILPSKISNHSITNIETCKKFLECNFKTEKNVILS